MSLVNSRDFPGATLLRTGRVPVTTQGTVFLRSHSKGGATLTDEESDAGGGTEGSRSNGSKKRRLGREASESRGKMESRSCSIFNAWAAASGPRAPKGRKTHLHGLGSRVLSGTAPGGRHWQAGQAPYLLCTEVCPQQKAVPGCPGQRKPQGILWCPQSFRDGWGEDAGGGSDSHSAQVPGLRH